MLETFRDPYMMLPPLFVQCIGEGTWLVRAEWKEECLICIIITSWVIHYPSKCGKTQDFNRKLHDLGSSYFDCLDYKLTVLVGNCTGTMCIQSAGRLI